MMTIKKLILSIFVMLALFSCSSNDDNDNTPSQCEIAIEAAVGAKQNYEAATVENYTQLCIAYRVALEKQQQECGDSDGSLQAIIDGLGDCSVSAGNEVEGQISVKAGTLSIVFDEIRIDREGGLLKILGETSAANNYNIYFEVEENMVGNDLFQNFKINLISSYYPMASNFNNSVTTNSGGVLTGSFSGVVINNDNGQIELTNGIFDLSF
ncbi:hypothetical protein EI546_03370 [Aequorivita sp. H23M31]|uniref:Lipoprotein n=1 Tax=Aequorivita ciconiae TaxID=2494375 RepID=A0A410G0M5_9FLAO|nr:hypothetical protein [Aequorivita sp. H23M31]QAA80826.1 hypothetical protein EI546_03370 [Aequorivita sp. H23M31]